MKMGELENDEKRSVLVKKQKLGQGGRGKLSWVYVSTVGF